jgi:tricorn protease-like protein
MKKTIISLLTAFSIIQVSAQEKSYFLSTPSLSPDGKTAYFAYDGDLWKVDSNGGNASRITALDGEEINPRISPDGKWLAFSSNQYGNYDVYVMPTEGERSSNLPSIQEKMKWKAGDGTVKLSILPQAGIIISGVLKRRLKEKLHKSFSTIILTTPMAL